MFTIKAEARDLGDKLDILRKSGKIPAVYYGTGKETTPISLATSQFKKLWRDAGESSIVKISAPTGEINALIHEVQVDPVTEEPLHADFLCVDMTKKVVVEAPLEFTGVSEAVKAGLGNLVKVLHEIEIEALPADLPHNLVVDISKLKTVEDQIFVSDIKLPVGVTTVTEGEDVVASIVLQVEEKEEEAPPADLSAIEVEKKGKKDEEDGESTEGAGAKEGVAPATPEAKSDKKPEK
jgi:large subunit ribosomal protein L25